MCRFIQARMYELDGEINPNKIAINVDHVKYAESHEITVPSYALPEDAPVKKLAITELHMIDGRDIEIAHTFDEFMQMANGGNS